jgi:preprotein translocase subunit YajC
MNNLWILAKDEGQEAPSSIPSGPITEDQAITTVPDSNTAVPKTETTRRPTGYSTVIFIGLMFVLMYFILFRGPQKQKQQHKKMVQTLEKNDRVRTIGGIIGTVVDIKDDEITLKVDESNNTKIKIVSSAIGKNLSKD